MSLSLNGTNQALGGQDWAGLELLGAFSLRATVSHAQSAAYPTLLSKMNVWVDADYMFVGYDRTTTPNRYRCHLISNSGTNVCLYDWEQAEDAGEHDLVFTYDSARETSRWMLWRDGVLLAVKTKHNDQAATLPQNATPVVLGHAYVGGTLDNRAFGWGGTVAEVRFWNRALPDDVAQRWSSGTVDGNPCTDLNGQVAYWPLGGCHGDHTRDLFGGYDLSRYNNPIWADHPPVRYPSDEMLVRRRVIEVRKEVMPIMLLGVGSRAV